MELGRRLRPLRAEGVLIVGSGFMTHGLPFLTREAFVDNVVPTWSEEFDHWAAEALAAGDLDRSPATGTMPRECRTPIRLLNTSSPCS